MTKKIVQVDMDGVLWCDSHGQDKFVGELIHFGTPIEAEQL